MEIKRDICPAGLANNPNRPLRSIDYITIHCTGNYKASADAASHARYQHGGSGGKSVSWHYTVDGAEIWQSFEDTQECWHAGDGNDGTGNATSIGIEICVNDKAAFPKACANAAWLTAELLRRHGLQMERVVQHNRWTGKNCPAELRSGSWGITWADFLVMVQGYLAPAAQKPLYRVQVGAYSTRANADAMLNRLRAAGFTEAFVKTE